MDTSEHIATRLQEEAQKVVDFFSNRPAEFWQQTIYTDGAHWTARQVLAHFVEAEGSIMRLAENIRGGGPGSPEDFDLNSYNERHVSRLDGVPPDELLARFTEQRRNTVQLVRQFTPEDLEKCGRHPWLGMTTIGEILKMIYRHNQIHIREMRQVFKAEAAG